MAKPSKQRTAESRANRKEKLGLVRCEVMTYEDCKKAIREYAAKLTIKRAKDKQS